MSETFTIRSVVGFRSLQLTPDSKDFIKVAITDSALDSSSNIAQLDGGDRFDEYWADIAEHWRGWSGAKVWTSLEGDLELKATCDKGGHVVLEATLQHGTPWTWQTGIRLSLEAGQLEGIALAARAFCQQLGATA